MAQQIKKHFSSTIYISNNESLTLRACIKAGPATNGEQ
jgi:hypothetical protein